MKRTVLFIVSFLLIISVCGCGLIHNEKVDKYSEICRSIEMKLPTCVIIEDYEDTHDGFLGDGDMVVKLSFSDTDCLNRIKESTAWKPLPLTKNLEAFVYGATYYGCYNAPYIHDSDYNPVVPKIENGYYCYEVPQEKYAEPEYELKEYSEKEMIELYRNYESFNWYD